MKFKKDFLQDLVGGGIVDEIIDHTRWSVVHWQVFKHEDKYYSTSYSVGATESQDESPYEYDKDELECPEVKPVEKTITVYEVVDKESR